MCAAERPHALSQRSPHAVALLHKSNNSRHVHIPTPVTTLTHTHPAHSPQHPIAAQNLAARRPHPPCVALPRLGAATGEAGAPYATIFATIGWSVAP